MPLLCRLPADQAASQMPPGKGNCFWRSVRPQTMRPPWVYLCPSTVAGIPSRLELVGKCESSKGSCPIYPKTSDLSWCKFHFKLFGALIVIVTFSPWFDWLSHWKWPKEEVIGDEITCWNVKIVWQSSISSNAEITTKIVTKRNRNDHARTKSSEQRKPTKTATIFFFGQSCARCNNSGSHGVMLK